MAFSTWETKLTLVVSLLALGLFAPWNLRADLLLLVLGAIASMAVLAIGFLGSSRRLQEHGCARLQSAYVAAPKTWEADTAWFAESSTYHRLSILPSSYIVSDSLDELLRWIVRDFVSSWHGGIGQREYFTNQVDSVIRNALLVAQGSLRGQDVTEALVSRVVPILTRHLKSFSEAERSVRGKKLNKAITESDEIDLAIAKRYNDGKLHIATSLASSDPEVPRQEHLRGLVSRLMPEILPSDIVQSKSTSTLIRELLSRVLLGPILSMIADPDNWNQVLEVYGKTMLQDRKTVRKLRAALDEHASPLHSTPRPQAFPKLSPYDDERKFERFIRAIRLCNSLSDARRFRSEITSQVTRESMQDGQDKAFLKRLETGKKLLDRRVSTLAAAGNRVQAPPSNQDSSNQGPTSLHKTNLVDVLRDASGLSYFMEYMDRQNVVALVQFWIVVDGIRDPLEDAPEGSDPLHVPGQWTSPDRHDIAQIFDTYLSRPELSIPPATHDAVQDFLQAKAQASPEQYGRARNALLRAQKAVLDEMQENYFPSFQRSDLFFKLLASDNPSTKLAETPLRQEDQVASVAPADGDSSLVSSQPFRPLQRSQVNRPVTKSEQVSARAIHGKASLKPDHRLLVTRWPSTDANGLGPLFDDADVDIASDSDTSRRDAQYPADQTRVVEAVEAALNDILTDEFTASEVREKEVSGQISESFLVQEPPSADDLFQPRKSISPTSGKEKPSISSLGLVSASSRIGVFMDDDLFGDEEKFIEDEHADPDDNSEEELRNDIQEAIPGDLGLSEAISALTLDIDRLNAQESVIDTLTRKAELTNHHSELRVLGKSKSSLQREIRRKELQKQQYMVQESDSSLYGRAKVDIKSVMVGSDKDSQEFAFYMVEVSRKAGEHMPAASWVVARRYSEFHTLHQRLRRMYPAVRHLNFPRRRLVMKLQTEFLQRRRILLEEYLQGLLRLPAVCTSRALRAFLSQRPITAKDSVTPREEREDLVSRIYSSVTDGMDEFLGSVPVLDQLSVAGQNILSTATSQVANASIPLSHKAEPSVNIISSRETQTELDAFDNQTVEPLVKPICDLFMEVFELNQSANWLRGRSLIIVLQQLLGGTIERKIRDISKAMVSDDALLKYIAQVKSSLWPQGSFRAQENGRSAAQKSRTRKEASIVLATILPELAGGVVGRANAQAAARRIFAAMNNSQLNTHLAFQLLDEVAAILFPQAKAAGRLR